LRNLKSMNLGFELALRKCATIIMTLKRSYSNKPCSKSKQSETTIVYKISLMLRKERTIGLMKRSKESIRPAKALKRT